MPLKTVSTNVVSVARPSVILALVLPQLALTSANSILGTRDVARRYFGERANRVTVRRLLASIGAGNILFSAVGGLPFCHGSGGVTAHVRGGATDWSMNVYAGLSLILLAALASFHGGVAMPQVMVASLLTVTGVFHLGLARPLCKTGFGWLELAIAGLLTWYFQNLLFTLAGVVGFEVLRTLAVRRKEVWI